MSQAENKTKLLLNCGESARFCCSQSIYSKLKLVYWLYTHLCIYVLSQLLMRHQRKMLQHHSKKTVKYPQFQLKQTLIQAGNKKHSHSQDTKLCRYICVRVYKNCVSNKGSYPMFLITLVLLINTNLKVTSKILPLLPFL